MKKEDIDFLKHLQKELLSQDNQGQASPVYWGIMETKQKPAYDGCGDETLYRIAGKDELFTEDELVKYVTENFYPDFTDDLKEIWDDLNNSEILRVWELEDFCDVHCGGCIAYEVNNVDELSRETGCFLTKSAAEEYIKRYGYNHSNPRTYAMTAYRNHELERLINIIKETDFEEYEI